jgi:hypothetical protein
MRPAEVGLIPEVGGVESPPPASGAGGAVDALAEQVGVAVVAGVLLDHVEVDPAQRAGLTADEKRVVQAGAGDRRRPSQVPPWSPRVLAN